MIRSTDLTAHESYSQSAVVEAMKPLPPLAIALSVLSAGFLMVVGAVSFLGVGSRDFARIVLGTSEAL
jgi:hypothetical protein